MDTTIDMSDEFDTYVLRLCTFPAYLSLIPACSLFTATSTTQLEDLSFLDNHRAAGHRGSVRKHNTAGRINDDLKGILWINLEARPACKYRLLQSQKLFSSTSLKIIIQVKVIMEMTTRAKVCCNKTTPCYPALSSHSLQGDWCHSNKLTLC